MSLYEELSDDLRSSLNNVQQIANIVSRLIQKANNNNNSNDNVKNGKNDDATSEKVSEATLSGAAKTDAAFAFSGQQTDLCYFYHCGAMPVEAIANIKNDKLREAVIDNFSKACNAGLVEIKDDMIIITDKGRKAISEPSFVKAAQKDQIRAYNKAVNDTLSRSCKQDEVQMYVELNGSYTQDFAFFRYSDSMDLNFLQNHPDKETVNKISKNIAKWEEKGFVQIDKVTNTARITEKGKKLVSDPQFVKSTASVSEKALSSAGTAGKIIAATKKVIQSAQAVNKATDTVSKGSRR